ncbi:MAG: YbhB/YbcL family Raf kinase inhibitor-like protein [Chromatiaceae bacterium]
MKLVSDSFSQGQAIPAQYAFARIAPDTHITLSDNINPHLAWTDIPAGTQSLVLICHDANVPSTGEDVNQEGKTLPVSMPRIDFFHWVLLDIPPSITEIPAGSHCRGVTPRGKAGPAAPGGLRHGLNDYTGWFAADAEMAGPYFGYDGPCPPWNDERLHDYVFTLYAIDVPALAVAGELDGRSVRQALEGHVLATGTLSGFYSLNPAVSG